MYWRIYLNCFSYGKEQTIYQKLFIRISPNLSSNMKIKKYKDIKIIQSKAQLPTKQRDYNMYLLCEEI